MPEVNDGKNAIFSIQLEEKTCRLVSEALVQTERHRQKARSDKKTSSEDAFGQEDVSRRYKKDFSGDAFG